MTSTLPIIIPEPLRRADRVAVLSPSGAVRDSFVDGMVEALAHMGLAPKVFPHARGRSGTYSAPADDRFTDLSAAILDRDIKAIFCTRGGYGAVQLLERLAVLPLRENAKWLVGFSDISALHALWQSRGIASILGPMGRYLTENPADHPAIQSLRDMLEGRPSLPVAAPRHELNRPGEAEGTLAGGNLAVLSSLHSTPYAALRPDSILVIEDINEPIYKIERMLWELRLSGVLPSLRGLACGQFTNTQPDANYPSAEAMIAEMTAPYDFPVAFGLPVGHIADNMPLLLGAPARLTVTPDEGATLLSDVRTNATDAEQDRPLP